MKKRERRREMHMFYDAPCQISHAYEFQTWKLMSREETLRILLEDLKHRTLRSQLCPSFGPLRWTLSWADFQHSLSREKKRKL